jgi:hypothetical protein
MLVVAWRGPLEVPRMGNRGVGPMERSCGGGPLEGVLFSGHLEGSA